MPPTRRRSPRRTTKGQAEPANKVVTPQNSEVGGDHELVDATRTRPRRSTRARTQRSLNYEEQSDDENQQSESTKVVVVLDSDDDESEEPQQDDSEEEELDELSSQEEEKPTKRKRKRAPPKALKKSPSSKKTKRTQTTQRKKSPVRKGKKAQAQSISPRSVAARGLPKGSKAVGRGGFEVRSLDGISPLLTVESVKKAITLISRGRYQEAARLLVTEHNSVQSFCEIAAKKLSIDVSFTSGFKGGRGSDLSSRAQLRLEQGLVPIDSPLPGRLMVVRAGNAINEGDGLPLCSPDLVGQVFESADDLHEHTATNLATYAMDSTGDAAFGPRNVVLQRLEAADLSPSSSGHSKETKTPFLVRVDWDEKKGLPVGSWEIFEPDEDDGNKEGDSLQWGLIEGASPDSPPVILGVSANLLSGCSKDDTKDVVIDIETSTPGGILPKLSPDVKRVRLPASLLQKSIRRNFCSPAPLLESCRMLLYGDNENSSSRGGVFEMLVTTWKCMLEDASPFDAPDDGSLLGFEELLLLSLIASADPNWSMPSALALKAVGSALRTQQQPASFSDIVDDGTPSAAGKSSKSRWELQPVTGRNVAIQNALIVAQAAVGGRFVNRSSFKKTEPITEGELTMVRQVIEFGQPPPEPELRLQKLDEECRLAAYDTNVTPSSLLFLQAALPHPPRSWKKHSLPMIARQVEKLIIQVNARMPDHHRLTRIAAWGNNSKAVTTMSSDPEEKQDFSSAREAVTTTGELSEKEHEIIDCFEAVQKQRFGNGELQTQISEVSPTVDRILSTSKFLRASVGKPASKYDGRMAFLLAGFGKAEEIEVLNEKEGSREVVNVLFCGDAADPLLVQRIGKARKEAEITSEAGCSGAKAVPSLGYVQRGKNPALVAAAEKALAARWEGGRTVDLPLPPPGFQWQLTGDDKDAGDDSIEKGVKLTATLVGSGRWEFTINDIAVDPFDARNVISACSLDLDNHIPVALGSTEEALVKVAFYVEEACSPSSILQSLRTLHSLATEARESPQGIREGRVFDWLPWAMAGGLTATIWRDVILAIKTREGEDVVLGPVLSDGTNKRDMSEGCLLRIFYTLEFLYPSVLIKNGALKWRVRPRGAGYSHLLACLEQLSRGGVSGPKHRSETSPAPSLVVKESPKRTTTRPQRKAAARTKKSISSCLDSETEEKGRRPSKRKSEEDDDYELEDYESLPEITTTLWPHQEASVVKVVEGVKAGRRGHADASAVGAGKTLTALATVVRLVSYAQERNGKRNGVLVMLPTKALISEWLIQIASHTKGFHVCEQREDGQLFSLTYGRSGCPIDGSTIVISTLDRVREHPFRQATWDFVVIDECLAVQNSAAKRCPSAWRQIEVSTFGVLLLSATFFRFESRLFRSKYAELFYMIRMLRCPLPRSMEWLAATINECIVCQVPENDRSWEMRGEAVSLPTDQLRSYRNIIEAFKRKQLNNVGSVFDGRRLFTELETFLRQNYEGRENGNIYNKESIMAKAFYSSCKQLLDEGRRPLVFADTAHEAQHILNYFRRQDLEAHNWSSVAQAIKKATKTGTVDTQGVIVATKSIEGQGINMQQHADAIVCRPTPGDHLEQMKGRVDRPGQRSKRLVLVVLMAEHTFEEAKFANIHLAGNFFREFIAPVAKRYREKIEKIDLEATLAAGGSSTLKPGTVSGAWRQSLRSAGQSGAFAEENAQTLSSVDEIQVDDRAKKRRRGAGQGSGSKTTSGNSKDENDDEPKFAPRNKVFRNKGDPEAVRQAKEMAKQGQASLAVRRWLFPPKKTRTGLPKESAQRFSDVTPPVVMNETTVRDAVKHLSKDPVLRGLISRVGADALIEDCAGAENVTNASLFNYCVRAVTFTMISVDAGNSFMRRFAMKIGACLECMNPEKRLALLEKEAAEMRKSGAEYNGMSAEHLMELLLCGNAGEVMFTPGLVEALVETCLILKGSRSGYPHLCGETFPCGKYDSKEAFLAKARAHAKGGEPVSAGYSKAKADFIISMVEDFKSKVTVEKISKASDREAAKMILGLKGIGDWSAGGVLMHCLKRANVMLYGDLTIRNYLNDLYEISHNETSETSVESAADFPDNAENRNLIDELSKKNDWEPYRSVVCLLMYHLQEENLVLL